MSGPAPVWAAPLLAAGVLAAGTYLTAVIHAAATAGAAGWGLSPQLLGEPWRRGALVALQRPASAERPDAAAWAVAPALYVALAAAGVAVIPWSRSFSIADIEAGIVWWGAAESLVIVAFFLHGWSSNSLNPLLAGYRVVAAALSFLLLSMFVLIAAALPAESLRLSDIVEAQAGLWNVVRQPLGLPLFLIVALGAASWGPMNLADGDDLAGGTSSEASGPPLLVWWAARASMLTAFSLMAATLFLGGWHGPGLPAPAWVALKAGVVLALLVSVGQRRARIRAERFVVLCWTVLLPLAFIDLAIAGVEALP